MQILHLPNAKELTWRYYNHALLPNCAPHEKADVEILKNKNFWKTFRPKRPLFACYTTHFDCGYETGWWHCILDKPFDIATIKSERRRQINQGLQNFDIRVIDVKIYAEQIFDVHKSAWKTYNKTGKFKIEKEHFCEEVRKWNYLVFGAFDKGNDQLVAYYTVKVYPAYICLMTLKANPAAEKKRVNLAINYFVCDFFRKEIENGKYIGGGNRNIYHKTNFQEFLEKNFGFKKAYNHLHIKYVPFVAFLIKILYPFRKIIKKIPFTIANQVSGILLMEEICRERRKFSQ